MSLRHAIVFAAVGWYLMVPPPSHTIRFDVEYAAPLSIWTVYQAFDSAEACEDFHTLVGKQHVKDFAVHPTNARQAQAMQIVYSQCIASDDPRLKP